MERDAGDSIAINAMCTCLAPIEIVGHKQNTYQYHTDLVCYSMLWCVVRYMIIHMTVLYNIYSYFMIYMILLYNMHTLYIVFNHLSTTVDN